MVCILTLGLINLVYILLVSNGSDFGTLTGEFGESNIELKWLDKFPFVWLIPDSTGSIWFSSEDLWWRFSWKSLFTKALCMSRLGAGLGLGTGTLLSSVGLSRSRGVGTGFSTPVIFPVLLALGIDLWTFNSLFGDSVINDKASDVLLWDIWVGRPSSSEKQYHHVIYFTCNWFFFFFKRQPIFLY